MWSHFLYLCVVFTLVAGKSSRSIFSAGIVEDIVKNEIQKKMPSASRSNKKSLKGFHLKEATDAINKLVDESIVDRVQEAEREVSKMLLKSIEHHIQDAGKVLLQQDENVCRDKLESCEKLADSGVCETSKDAMIVNCPQTCNFCGMLKELKQEKMKEDEESNSLATPISKPKKKKKHRHHHHHSHQKEFQQTSKLNPEETQQIHQNMIDQTIDHANLPMAVDNTPEQQTSSETSQPQTEEPVQQENNNARDADEAEAERQKQEEEEEEERQKAEEEQQKEEERRDREQRRRERERRKKKAAAKQHAASVHAKENYFASQCHPLCAKECIASCAPGCCDHRIPAISNHIMNRKRCHPMCKKICLPSCGVGCCTPGIKSLPQQQAGMCPPGCPLPCAPNCLDSCCFPRPRPPPILPPALPAVGLPLCLGSCINSCDSSCPASCCPSNMEVNQCPAPCGGSCAPSCTPECCGGSQLPELPLPVKKPDVQLPSYPISAPIPDAFNVCPGSCPKTCAPGCEFDCCKPFLDPGVVQQMSPTPNEFPSLAPPAPPMSRVIHVQHVLSPQQEIATAPAVSEVPATCPAECQQHCGPACARDGCCTDKKRKRSKIPKVRQPHKNFFEHGEFEYGEPFFYIDEQ